MKLKITVILLSVLLAGGIAFSIIQINVLVDALNDLNARYYYLLSQYNSLTVTYNSLQSDYDSLASSHTTLQSQYDSLTATYTELDSKYDTLETKYNELDSDYDKLEWRMSDLQSRYNSVQSENSRLQSLLDEYEKVPNGYYSSGDFQHHSNTLDQLFSFLKYEFHLPRGYQTHVFDCSESTAYLEWALENAGFGARIAVGRAPWNPTSGYHAWVIAYTADNYRVAIEATALTGESVLSQSLMGRTPGVIYSNDSLVSSWQNYYEGYDNLYQNIFRAIRSDKSVGEWNWWVGYWGFK